MKASDLVDTRAIANAAVSDYMALSLDAINVLQREARELREALAESLLREHDAVNEATRLRLELEKERERRG